MSVKRMLGRRAVASLLVTSSLAACSGGGNGGGRTGLTLSGAVTTLAGSAAADGVGPRARFISPHGIVREGTALYVADTFAHTIRRIEIATGVVTTIAGEGGTAGSADGVGSAARFDTPHDLASDGTNLYVTDFGNTIRKIELATGAVTTLAGTAGQVGSADGLGAAARFSQPSGIAREGAFLYVADYGNHTIRRVEIATGDVTTIAGSAGTPGSVDGTGTAARFNAPYGITSVGSDLYVTDYGRTVRRIDTLSGAVTTIAGIALYQGYADGVGTAARFALPFGVVHVAGALYVAEWGNQRLRRIAIADSAVSTLAGDGLPGFVDATGAAARFNAPHGVASDDVHLYVVDTFNDAVRKVHLTTADVTTLAGPGLFADGTGAAARFRRPSGVAASAEGVVYVADLDNNTIRKVTPGGVVSTLAGMGGVRGSADGTGSAALFSWPASVAVDAAGTAYVADQLNHAIRKITPAGAVTTLAGQLGSSGSADGTGASARFYLPGGVAVDSGGTVFVADTGNHVIRKITPAGVVTTLAGLAGTAGAADGFGASARFAQPSGVAVDAAGNVYAADHGNDTVRKITPAGAVSTLAGLAGTAGSADGTGTAARFWSPYGVAVDAGGNVFVADTRNHTTRKITPAGVVTTLAGSAGTPGSADGTGAAARFSEPAGIATDGTKLYVADTGGDTIRVIR